MKILTLWAISKYLHLQTRSFFRCPTPPAHLYFILFFVFQNFLLRQTPYFRWTPLQNRHPHCKFHSSPSSFSGSFFSPNLQNRPPHSKFHPYPSSFSESFLLPNFSYSLNFFFLLLQVFLNVFCLLIFPIT